MHGPNNPLLSNQVHDYNRVVSGLDARERALFHDRLRALDRRVTPGTGKLTWTSDRAVLEFYFREVRGRRTPAARAAACKRRTAGLCV
jgi:hypothetical protein